MEVSDTTFNEEITKFFNQSFPILERKRGEILNLVVEELVGSKQVRYGKAPPPENLVAIRSVVKRCMGRGEEITCVVPWGSVKPFQSGIDIAEVSGLKTLTCLNERVKRFYEPGLKFNIRVEDLSGWYLFDDPIVKENSDHYCLHFKNLVDSVGMHAYLESSYVGLDLFRIEAEKLRTLMLDYLLETDYPDSENDNYVAMEKLGWKGDVPREQRQYYYERYKKLYPGSSMYDNCKRLARYFAQAYARYSLNLRMDFGHPFIQITFVPPVPGAPDSLTCTNLYYRVLPIKYGETHCPPWRAKGYLKIANGKAVPALRSPKDRLPLISCLAAIGDAIVHCDYLTEES